MSKLSIPSFAFLCLGFVPPILPACKPAGAPVMSSAGSSDVDDPAVYTIRGTVGGDTEEMLRQVSPARATMIDGYASYSGPIVDGKTILALEVLEISKSFVPRQASETDEGNGEPEQSTRIDWIEVGESLIVKCVDTKCIALRPGNTATFKCRRNYEALATTNGEQWDADFFATYEIDYCRLETGVVE